MLYKLIKNSKQLIPIEVKSADNTKAKSLKVYMEIYDPPYAIKLSVKNFSFENNKKSFRFMPHSVYEYNRLIYSRASGSRVLNIRLLNFFQLKGISG